MSVIVSDRKNNSQNLNSDTDIGTDMEQEYTHSHIMHMKFNMIGEFIPAKGMTCPEF